MLTENCLFLVIKSSFSSVDSNDISKSMNDWEVFELVGVHDHLSILVFTTKSWVNNLQDAHKHFVGFNLIWESGINDNTVEVAEVFSCQFSFAKLDVVVFGAGFSWAGFSIWSR